MISDYSNKFVGSKKWGLDIVYGGTYGTTYYTNDNTNYYVILT